MPRPKPKAKASRRELSTGEQEQIADERVERRMLARARRIRAMVRAIDRESQRLDTDLEALAMGVLRDRGFVIVGKKQHDDLINDNIELRQHADRLERELAKALGEQPAPVV